MHQTHPLDKVQHEIERLSSNLEKFIAEMLKKKKTAFDRLRKPFFSVQTATIEEPRAKVIVIRCFTRATSKRCSSEKWITLHICFLRCVDFPSTNLDMENFTDIGGCAEKWFLEFMVSEFVMSLLSAYNFRTHVFEWCGERKTTHIIHVLPK